MGWFRFFSWGRGRWRWRSFFVLWYYYKIRSVGMTSLPLLLPFICCACSSSRTKPTVLFPLGLLLGHSITPLIVPLVSFQLLKSSPSGKWLSNSSWPQKDRNRQCVKELSPPYNPSFEEREGLLSKLLLSRTVLSRSEVRSWGGKLPRRQLCEREPGWLQTRTRSASGHRAGKC